MRTDTEEQSMDGVAAERVEVKLLTDLPVDKDAFGGHQRVADAIADVILYEQDGGKAIALEGGWGSGKSSVVKMLEMRLKIEGNSVCTFDAWAHEGDPLRRAFLQRLTEHCIKESNSNTFATEWNKKHKKLVGLESTQSSKHFPHITQATPLILAVIVLYPVALLAARPILYREPDLAHWFLWVVGSLSAPFVLLLVFWLILGFVGDKSKHREGIERILTFWMNKTIKSTDTVTSSDPESSTVEFEDYFASLMAAGVPKGKRLVIVLDNLDRVPKETAEALWSTIRLFAETLERKSEHDGHWTERLWLLVPYDREGAGAIWKRENPQRSTPPDPGDESNKESSKKEIRDPKLHSVSAAFFDKAFQVRFTVPPLHIADWEDYLKELVRTAMPTVGTKEELHRVYRLSERLADENGRPPSPRALKLYVNDIGALVRQFQIGPDSQIRLDHLALYAILRRQDEIDVVSWVLSGDHLQSLFTSVMVGDSYVDAVLAVHFGTDDFARARTITLRGPLRQALRTGDGERLKEIAASVPAFWSVAENELPRSLDDGGTKQVIVVKIAQAIETSEIASNATGPYASVIPRYARLVLDTAQWSKLNLESAKAAGFLLRLVADSSVTQATLDKLVTGASDGKATIDDPGLWAQGAIHLFTAVQELGHVWNASLSSDPNTAKTSLVALIDQEAPEDLFKGLKCLAKPADLVTAIGPRQDEVWDTDGFNAIVVGLLQAPQIVTPWKAVLDALAQRLQVSDVEDSEAELLWEAFYECYPKAQKDAQKGLSEVVAAATFYPLAEQWAGNPCVVAYMLAAMILTKQIGRAVASSSEQAGFNVFGDIYNDASQHADVVKSLVTFIPEYPRMGGLLSLIIEQRSELSTLATEIVTADEIRDGLGRYLSVPQFFKHYTVLSEELEDDLIAATNRALNVKSFADALDQEEVRIDQANVHYTLVAAGALSWPNYRSKLANALDQAAKDVWEEAIINAGWQYRLLVLALKKDVSLPTNLSSALESLGRKMVSAEPPTIQWGTMPEEWDVVFSEIDANTRGTIANYLVDDLDEHSVPQFGRLIGLFSDDFHKAFGKSSETDLVRKIAKPILESKEVDNLRWLLNAAQSSTEFWKHADNADRGTFERRLVEAYQADENDELRTVLGELAEALNITIPPPQSDTEEDAAELEDSEEATTDEIT